MDGAASPSGLSGGAMVVPIAHIGALSQAWFDALGLARPKDVAHQKSADATPLTTKAAAVKLPMAAFDTPQATVKAPEAIARKNDSRTLRSELEIERAVSKRIVKRGTGLAQAQGGSQDVLRRSAGRIVIHSTRGAVKMLVQRDNNRLVITAVCNSKIADGIAAALKSAQQKLRARGIVADVHTYGENAA